MLTPMEIWWRLAVWISKHFTHLLAVCSISTVLTSLCSTSSAAQLADIMLSTGFVQYQYWKLLECKVTFSRPVPLKLRLYGTIEIWLLLLVVVVVVVVVVVLLQVIQGAGKSWRTHHKWFRKTTWAVLYKDCVNVLVGASSLGQRCYQDQGVRDQDQDQQGRDRDRDQDQGGRDQDQDQQGRDQDQHPRPRPMLSWSRPAHTNSSFINIWILHCSKCNNAQKRRNRSVKHQASQIYSKVPTV